MIFLDVIHEQIHYFLVHHLPNFCFEAVDLFISLLLNNMAVELFALRAISLSCFYISCEPKSLCNLLTTKNSPFPYIVYSSHTFICEFFY